MKQTRETYDPNHWMRREHLEDRKVQRAMWPPPVSDVARAYGAVEIYEDGKFWNDVRDAPEVLPIHDALPDDVE